MAGKSLRNSAVFAALCSVLVASSEAARLSEDAYNQLFVRFAKENHRTYAVDEIFDRLKNFKDNVDFVLEHNAKKDETFTVGLNQFADWSLEEFEDYLKSGFKAPANYKTAPAVELSPAELAHQLRDLPEEVDWEEQGFMSEVRNQGGCGSCYAFSALGTLEGRFGIARGQDQMQLLSPQSIVDCDRGNGGCSGGFMSAVYNHLIRQRGGNACTEASYPYKGKRGSCQSQCESGAVLSSYVDVSGSDSSVVALMKAVSTGPVAVAVQANSRAIMNYKGGIISAGCPNNALDHAVILYGYGKDTNTGVNYWKLRNSWSARWGNKGDFFVKFDTSRDGHLCGVRSMTTYPVVPSLKEEAKTFDYSHLFDAEN